MKIPCWRTFHCREWYLRKSVRGWAPCTCVLHTFIHKYNHTEIHTKKRTYTRSFDSEIRCLRWVRMQSTRARSTPMPHPETTTHCMFTIHTTQHTVFAAGLRAFRQQLRQCHATRSVAPCVTKKRSQPGAIVEDVICGGVVNAHISSRWEWRGWERGGRMEKTSRCSRSHRSRSQRSHAPVLAHVPGSQRHAARGPLTGG